MSATPEDRRPRPVRLVVLLLLLASTIAGACALSFQCDDAYITFRYVSNAMDGHGLVWNPPPFQPVEGYTGFLWALLLWGVWAVLGVEPPAAANVLSVGFGVLQFAVVAFAAFRLRGRDGARVPDGIALAAVACVVGQRTFLQWMTSGLETALFNVAFLGWALLGFVAMPRRDVRWLATWSAAAAVAALTRPDGLLLVAVTGAVAWPSLAGGPGRVRRAVIGLLPLATVVAHVVWRKSFYGEWLPNTHYAKILAPWPEVGIPALECFLFEHGLWAWFPIALAWAAVWIVRQRGALRTACWQRVPAFAVLGAVAFHAGYYVLKVGGDHFEYRVLSQLVPLAWLSLAVMSWQLFARVWATLAALAVVFVCSGVGWVHWAISGDMAMNGLNPVAGKLPTALQPIAKWYDNRQFFLHLHFVCLRANQHRTALETFMTKWPPRGRFATDDDVPVLVEGVVGVAGWVLRDVAIIDSYGLNDWVIARTALTEWTAVPGVVHFRELGRLADTDGDGWISRDETRAWFAAFAARPADTPGDSALIDIAFDMFAHERRDGLRVDEAMEFSRCLIGRGAMAHERMPPPGYVDSFEPNVTASPSGVVVRPRQAPLRSRVPAIESEWRAKAARGELHAR